MDSESESSVHMATHVHIGTIERANDAKPKDENEGDGERSSPCQAEYLSALYDKVRSPDQ